MNILIDIGHPAHVHLFKHFAWEMQKKGHKVLFTCREKEFEIDLLRYYQFEFVTFGKKYSTSVGKIFGMIEFDIKEIFYGLKFKPDVFLSHGSIYAAHASFILRKPHISFEDTFNFEQIRLYAPFTDVILTSDYENPLKSKNVIKYAGYHELAYLHPKRFPGDYDSNSGYVSPQKSYALLRFVAWKASHDAGHKGISPINKVRYVEELSKYVEIFISSEGPLLPSLEKYKISIPPQCMHHFISNASMIFGESATMVSEGAVLGVPGIYIDNVSRYYTIEQEKKYGLVFNFTESEEDQEKALAKAVELLSDPATKQKWLIKRDRLLEDKIDVTSFLVWFIENYPQSKNIMHNDSSHQLRFK